MPEIAGRILDALPDTLDFRDAMYTPSLIRVPPVSDLKAYRSKNIPVLDQGAEGACTGFGLATVANYLLRVRGKDPKAEEVSAWMLYAMAKRYDEWPGEDYSGSSARGAMKGWHKHGVCANAIWADATGSYADKEAANAIARPLGAYYRVNHRNLVDMHAAISEVGILYATASIHRGWESLAPGKSDIIFSDEWVGGHAFAIVGYDREGLWIQNSWGEGWGDRGLARLSYDDWLVNGSDVWVASLGVPISLTGAGSATLRAGAPRTFQSYAYSELRPHIVTSKNDGVLDDKGDYGLTDAGLRDVVTRQMPGRMEGWDRKRVLLYAHGGLVPESYAVQIVADYRQTVLDNGIYPLAFVWRSDAWTTIENIVKDAFSRRRDEGLLDRAKDFMLDRLDDMLEMLSRNVGKAMWDEMKENALLASANARGAARMTADLVAELAGQGRIDEVHLAGHSAGAIFLAPLATHLADAGVQIASLSLLAPACTMDLFEGHYRPLIDSQRIARFGLYTMDDATERDDDCAHIYHKSLLYLVSAAFEAMVRIPWDRSKPGERLLGLARDVKPHFEEGYWADLRRRWIVSPGNAESDARHHGDFDNDLKTLRSVLARILDVPIGQVALPKPQRGGAPANAARVIRELDRIQ